MDRPRVHVLAGTALLAGISLGAGCASLDALPPPTAMTERWWEAKAAQPTPTISGVVTPTPEPEPQCSIAVFESEPPEPFDLIGLVEAEGHGLAEWGDSALEAAKIQACRLGGDALVLLFRRGKERSGFEPHQGPPTTLPRAELRAAVIRYRRQRLSPSGQDLSVQGPGVGVGTAP